MIIVGDEWRLDALCAEVDTDMFFPVKGEPTNPAKSICRRCDVQRECLEYALANETSSNHAYGVWGGMSARERRAELRRRAVVVNQPAQERIPA